MVPGTYPTIVKTLPEIDIPLKGVKGWLAQGDTFQIVFFEIQAGTNIPAHSHEAQFGFVLEGSMTLTIGEEIHHLNVGDSYFIPAQVIHYGESHTFVRAMDFFNEPARYQPK